MLLLPGRRQGPLHGSDVGGEGDGGGGAADVDFARESLQRPVQDFDRVCAEPGQFVEKEDAAVGEGAFARPGPGAAADQPGIADGVVRAAEGAPLDEGGARLLRIGI